PASAPIFCEKLRPRWCSASRHRPPPAARLSVARVPVRGLDQFDTPPIALAPLFEHEPLLSGLTTVCEPFCGKGNLAIAMRERGLTVFASDIVDRGCPDSTVLDFFAMTEPPPGCDTLITNPAYQENQKPLFFCPRHPNRIQTFTLALLNAKLEYLKLEYWLA